MISVRSMEERKDMGARSASHSLTDNNMDKFGRLFSHLTHQDILQAACTYLALTVQAHDCRCSIVFASSLT